MNCQRMKERENTREGNALDSVERVGAELLSESHEVALDERNLVGETGLRGVLASAEDLELVIVETDNCRRIESASSLTRKKERAEGKEEKTHPQHP